MFLRLQLCSFVVLLAINLSAKERIPDWFFNADPRSNVGVSYPIKGNAPARETMALMIAILQNRCIQADCHTNALEIGNDIRVRHSFEDKWSFSYLIENRYLNDIGEGFVKVKITDGDDYNIKMSFLKIFEGRDGNYPDIEILCRIHLDNRVGLKSDLFYNFRYSKIKNDFRHYLEFISRPPQGAIYVLKKEINKDNPTPYKYHNCKTSSDFSLATLCDNSLFIALLQTIVQGEGKGIFPIGIKDNNLHFLYY